MNFTFSDADRAELPARPSGILRVIVPHWAAEISVLDSSLKPVPTDAKVRADDSSRSRCSWEAALPVGLYQVRVALEGAANDQWAPVEEGQITEISLDTWKDLKFTSSSPMRDVADHDERQTESAARMSGQRTWSRPDIVDRVSRLFIFVRTGAPGRSNALFYSGLSVLDESGETIKELRDGVEVNMGEGWMSFCTDLPPGGYILRRGRRGVQLRFQPFHLCRGWETHIFLKADKFPSLSTWSLNMSRLGTGFHPEDETALASEAITDSLRHATSDRLLLQNERIEISLDTLLEGKFQNPWLGVLGAYAIGRLRSMRGPLESRRKQIDDEESRRVAGAKIEAIDSYSRILRVKVLPFLRRELGEHPDVRAIELGEGSPADLPFQFPPTLRMGVQMVQAHALRHPNAIPIGSLMERSLDNLLSDSPWTAWRKLSPTSSSVPASPSSSVARRASPTVRRRLDFSVSSVLSRTAVPRTPVFRITKPPASSGFSSTDTVLRDAPMIQKVKEAVLKYSKKFLFEDLPREINLNSRELMSAALSQTSAEEVSAAFGIPLSRTLETLAELGGRAAAARENGPGTPPSAPGSVEQAVLEHALGNFGRQESSKRGGVKLAPKHQIREFVSRMQGEADRLALACSASSRAQCPVEEHERHLAIADKLYSAAERLLRHGDFVTITDAPGRILYSNGSFLLLISPRGSERLQLNAKSVEAHKKNATRKFEQALRKVEPGVHRLRIEGLGKSWTKWKLSRTEIVDEARPQMKCRLNIMRLERHGPLDEARLKEINLLVGELLICVPLLIYGSGENRKENEKAIRSVIERLAHATRNGEKE